jgi:RNA polymerase sigma-70 factor (ECF subfamily)
MPPCPVSIVAICLRADFPTNYFMSRVYFPADPDDLDLVRQSLAGQTEAFGVLVNRYQKVMYTVALRMLGNAEDARDATQDAFVKAYQHLATFDSRYRFYSWMYRILVNECLNVNRDRHTEEQLDADAAGAGSPFDSALASERVVQINMALEQLTPEYRAVVVLRHFAGQSYSEIADALSIPEKTVKSRLYSARQRLGELLLGWKESEEDEDR